MKELGTVKTSKASFLRLVLQPELYLHPNEKENSDFIIKEGWEGAAIFDKKTIKVMTEYHTALEAVRCDQFVDGTFIYEATPSMNSKK